MFDARFRLGAPAAAAQLIARLHIGISPIGPAVLYVLVHVAAALANLNKGAMRRGFEPPSSLVETKQALS
jgi:hypothetical protein